MNNFREEIKALVHRRGWEVPEEHITDDSAVILLKIVIPKEGALFVSVILNNFPDCVGIAAMSPVLNYKCVTNIPQEVLAWMLTVSNCTDAHWCLTEYEKEETYSPAVITKLDADQFPALLEDKIDLVIDRFSDLLPATAAIKQELIAIELLEKRSTSRLN